MRKTLCKRLFIFLMAFCVFNFSASSQDSSKTVTPPEKPVTQAPIKKATKAISKPSAAVSTQPAKKVEPVPAPAQPIDNSLEGQYEALLKHSWMQQGYKVVNPTRLSSLWKSVNDTINDYKKQLSVSKQQTANLEKQLSSQDTQPINDNKVVESPKVPVSEIQVLGMYLNANTYNWIVWGIILVLAIALTTILLTTAKRANDSKHYKQIYEELSSEYQSFKTKSKEKELKLARELQTERNTIEELTAKRNEEGPGKKS